jgi:Domain of unknown function (DUF4278)
MQLIYRGTTFNYDPAERVARRLAERTFKAPYELMYRGTTYRIDPMAIPETPAEPAVYALNCRGTTYQMHRNEQGESTAINSSVNAPKQHFISCCVD